MKNKLFLIVPFLFTAFLFAQTTAGEYSINNLESNTENSDFGTSFFGNDKIIFSSSRGEGWLKSKWDNDQSFLDLYEAVIGDNGSASDVKIFSTNLNTKFHEASVSFSPDQKTVYFTRNNYYKNKLGESDDEITNLALYKASITPDGSWTDVQPMPFNNVSYSVGSPSVSEDGKKLYFASDMPGSYGLTDIFVVDILDNGTYGIPQNLGKKVNTLGVENFPFIDKENVLYYSSDSQKDGMGGLDVYAVKIYEESISESLHLGQPINSEKDDFGYILKNDIHEGYFSSNRTGGKGDDDIYHFTASPPLKIECNQIVQGYAKDKKTDEILTNATVVIFDKGDNEIDTKTTTADGAFKFSIPCDGSYKVIASKEQYESAQATFTTKNNPDTKVNLVLKLEPIIIPEVIVVREKVIVNINPIYFDFDKADIRTDAAYELDKVVAIMQKHPVLMIEGGSHTDSRGPESYNAILSSRRANSTVNYIINHGIDASRISAKGYGESVIINHCIDGIKCSEENHQQNRRTEFVILNPDVLGYR